ncbi:MAG: tol-pal system-associated acyl-CoA thioesterase [Ferrimonas sp.]
MRDTTHIWPIRVYYGDTDAGGVVYHANYLNFFDQARTEFMRQIGHEWHHDEPPANMFVVGQIQISYLRPARLNQQLYVHSRVSELGRASMAFEQRLVDDEHHCYCHAQVQLVCVAGHNLRPIRIPESIRKELIGAR